MIGSRYTYIVWSKMVPHIEGFRPAQVLKLAKLGVERDHLLHSLICKETWFHLSHSENMPQRKILSSCYIFKALSQVPKQASKCQISASYLIASSFIMVCFLVCCSSSC